ncbi:uncharacterized protein LOC116259395 [Nymphaea colorata]|nr:uncharacterized protein LOC116259395 [Nymphaea colorata]
MVLHKGGAAHPLEVVETVLEVADVAWAALERRHDSKLCATAQEERLLVGEELERQRAENHRLRAILEENTRVFEALQRSLSLSKDCPDDLYEQLLATLETSNFLKQLDFLKKSLSTSTKSDILFKEIDGETLISVELEEPSWWVLVTGEVAPNAVEEFSGIDDESYLIVNEQHVVDGIANFMATCIVLNPKSRALTPEELHKVLLKAFGHANHKDKIKKLWHAGKILYTLSTWGIALAGLYRHRVLIKAAAKGVGATGKVMLKCL